MISKCAYCGRENVTFTKEHIYPKCLYEETPDQNLHYFVRINKVIETQVTIKDVCSGCNNGELSKLDKYFCELFEAHIKNIVHRNEVVNFEYDFDTLARWLLKVSYNSARSSRTNSRDLSIFTDYILHNVNRPNNLVLFVQLIIPYQMTKKQLETIPRASELPNGEIPPSYTHTGEYEIPIGNDKYHPGRFFAINSYFFHIFFRPEATHERIWKKFIQRVPLLIPGATQLHRMKHKVTIKASNINTLQANKDFLKSHESAYLKWKSTKQN